MLLEGLEELSSTMAIQANMDTTDIRRQILGIGQSINDWFHKRIDYDTTHKAAYQNTMRP